MALAFDIGAVGRTVVVVAPEKLFTTDVEFAVAIVVFVSFAVTITGTVVLVTVVTVVFVTLGTVVVTGDVEEGGGDEAAGSRGADVEVRVKTRTIRRSGLDHVRR